MPRYVAGRVETALKSAGRTVCGSRILLLGIAYKADVDDDRESPAYVLWNLLERGGAAVNYHDPHVPVIRPSRERGRLAGRASLPLTAETLAEHDLVLVVTGHRSVDYVLVVEKDRLIVDTRNILGRLKGLPRYFPA